MCTALVKQKLGMIYSRRVNYKTDGDTDLFFLHLVFVFIR